jgi:signal transduction histidine kinase
MDAPSVADHRPSIQPSARPSILCVDDEPHVLDALKDVLHRHFSVTTATSGRDALRVLADSAPFCVVVSDFAMPDMNGAEFLANARVTAPDMVRVLLTGHASLTSAIAAVNDGHVFRLLTKPCPPPVLIRHLDEAVDQYRLVTGDRELLEHKLESLSEHLLRAERLASLGTLAGVVGHELNNVLTMLQGSTWTIQNDVAQGRLPSTQNLRILGQAGDRIALHSRSLLELGRPARAGDRPAIELTTTVREVLGTLQAAGLLRRVRLQFDSAREPLAVTIGRTAMEQILVNLVKNAVEALSEVSRQDPHVRVSLGRAADRADRAECVVADNANGIPEAKLPLIFEPYYTTKPPERGTGLGLFAVRQLAREAGGEVSVVSRVGEGTTFSITLPLQNAHQETEHREE